MEQNPDIKTQFQRLDAAIARDVERRRRSTWILLALLSLIAAAAVYALLKGNEEVKASISDKVADDIVSGDQLVANVAERAAPIIASRPELATMLSAPSLDQRYVTRQSLESLVRAMIDANPSPAPSPDPAPQPPSDPNLDRRLGGLEELLRAHTARVTSMEQNQRALSEAIADTQTQLALIAEQVQSLDALADEAAANRTAIDGLAGRLESLEKPRRMRSYLLKTNARNQLSDLSLSVELGALTDGDAVSFQFYDERTGTTVTDVQGGNAAIGDSFCLRADAQRRYLATFAYAHRRAIVRDFVGLEIVALPAASDECPG